MTRSRITLGATVAAGLLVVASHATAQGPTGDEMNQSNSPLNPAPSVNLHDYYSPELYDIDDSINDFLVRGSFVLPPGKLLPWPQLIRATLPISSRPHFPTGSTTALGDFNVFDLFLLGSDATELGIGPLVVAPTASDDDVGAGKWQAGLAAIAVHPTARGLLGGLVQWQASFAGDEDRADVGTLTVQPLLVRNMPNAWY